MKKFFMLGLFFCACLLTGNGKAFGGGLSFSAYDIKNYDYGYPSFKIVVKTPDGNMIGWDKDAAQWTGTIIESKINAGTFNYPEPSDECTSTEPEVRSKINLPQDIVGDYTVLNALYCKDIFTGVNSFIGSGYGINVGGAYDARYDIIIYPERYAKINMCFSYYVEGKEQINELCLNEKFTRDIILSPGVEQTIEFGYSSTTEDANTLAKVITPSTLSGSWETCEKLGMVKNSGLYTSVQKKLENATRKYEEGDTEAANNIYGALVNELEAQYGKGVDAECADLLMEDLKAGVR